MIKEGNAISRSNISIKFANPHQNSYFSLARCQDSVPSLDYDTVHVSLWSFTEICKELEDMELHDDLHDVAVLSIGESLALGFPQGSYDGIIVTRIR